MDASGLYEPIPKKPTTNARIGAVVAGIAVAVASVIMTFGASIISLIAIWIGWAIARRRALPFTRGVGWVVGVGAVGAVVLSLFVVVVSTQVPRGELTRIKQSMDSAAAAPQKPPPEWLRKITPPATRQQSRMTESIMRSSAFTTWTMVMGLILVVALIGAYVGTLAWLASMLLAYGLTGDWFPRGMTDPSLLTAPAPLPPRA